MAATSVTNYEKFYKELYKEGIADLTFDTNAFLALVPKNPNTGGVKYIRGFKDSYPTGRSAAHATAHANIGPSNRVRWEMDWYDHYVKCAIANKTIELAAGAGRRGSLRDALVDEADGGAMAFANDVEIVLHEDGTGTRGVTTEAFGATTAGYVGVEEGQGVNFNVGDLVVHLDSSNNLLDSGATVTVTEVDADNDSIGLSADFPTPITGAGEKLVLEGDQNAVAPGLKAWLPGSGVSATLFNGVDRSVYPQRRAGTDGVQGTLSGLLITDALVQTCAKIAKYGGRPNLIMISPEDFADFALETENRGRYAKVSATTGSVSFSALEIQTGAGAVPVVADRHTQSDQAFILDTRKIELYSTNTLPAMFKRDGSFYNRTEGVDEINFYWYGFYGLALPEPGSCSWIQDLY